MKAVVLTGIRKLKIRDLPDPEILDPRDVLLRVAVVGVCGSDIHYYTTGRIGSQVVQYPFCVGHECAATVVSTGPGVSGVRTGDRVAVDPAISCGACDQCRAGRPHTCRRLRFLGTPGQGEGCLCEFIVMPESCCFPVGSRMTLEQAALSEPFAIGVYAVKLAALPPGAKVAILGAGPIGLSVLLAARHAGTERVFVTDKIEARLNAAGAAGADWTGNPDRQDVVRDIAGRESLFMDAVFECCGEQSAMDQAVDLLKPGGRLLLVGIPEADRVSFVIDQLRRKEIVVQNVRRQNHCARPALDLIETGAVNVDFMVTHRFRLEQTSEAFDLVAGYRDGVIKAMIRMA